ncbi:E2F-associated phosphoprotein-like isoform X2 [Mya arenaria]|uniref:E2F-associated phosphoprotein-like isoform X2 n=1 Tax=Mya arenaria TaxID=6604 RepID=UPI0022E0F8C2|nr:E2F-associated phosphoprotein-like isoform X2 [Mya arenaria]
MTVMMTVTMSVQKDDEIDILLHGTPEQKCRLCQPSPGVGVVQREKPGSEDEWEKEMNAELNGRVKELERRRGSLSDAGCSGGSVMDLDTEEPVKFYDDVYFDSDEEDMVNTGDAAQKKRKQHTDEDLLYNPEEDEDNEKWIESRRREYLPKPGPIPGGSKAKTKKKKPLPSSDAVLDCPACMTTLCMDCQRHDVYNNQYRAMFVSNCKVEMGELLKFPKASNKRNRKSKSKEGSTNEPSCDDMFNPVKCTECNTVVAVYDRDEVYHFFNVLASY